MIKVQLELGGKEPITVRRRRLAATAALSPMARSTTRSGLLGDDVSARAINTRLSTVR